MQDNPFYSIRDSKTYMLFHLFKKGGKDPLETMQDVLRSATVSGGYVPNLAFPSQVTKMKMAKKFLLSIGTAKYSEEKIFYAGANAVIQNMKGKNTAEEFLKREAEHKIYRPIDLTLRDLAFVTKIANLSSIKDLIANITKGITPESKDMIKEKDWRRTYELEKFRHEETKNRLGQIHDEREASVRIIAELRNLIHGKGLQDPTLQVIQEGGENPIAAVDKDDDPNGNP
jgi:hypothetical protein